MPWSGTTFTRDMGPYDGATCWQETDAAHFGIQADHHDVHDQDIADGINACINRTGANTVQGNIPMGGFKLTGLAAGTAAGESVRFEQLELGVMTTRGDMLFRDAAGTARLPKGTNGQVIMAGVNDPQYVTPGSCISANTGTSGHAVPFLDGTNIWTAPQRITIPGAGILPLRLEVNNVNSVPLYTEHNEAPGGGVYNYHTQHAQYAGLPGFGSLTVVGAIRSTVGTSAAEFYGGSDRRLKESITDLDDAGAVLDALKPRRFKWKGTEVHDAGFVADEVQDVLPNAVDGERNGPLNRPQLMAPGKLIPFLVAEVKSLRKRVAELENGAA